jgi:hypothetical protein
MMGREGGAQRVARERGGDPSECRCLCGSLVARRVPQGVELKCRRCKRNIVLPLEPDTSPPRATEPVS